MLTADHDEWTAGAILMHLVRSAGFYVSRVTGEPLQTDFTVPMNKKDVGKIAARSAIFDARLRELASEPEGMTSFVQEGKTIHRARSTILAQSIHHATEHRAQIADVLALHGITVVNLDEMDVWAYSDFEGLGQ